MHLNTAIFLFFASAIGGGINAVAGGGSFVAFPALLFTGVPAIPANATNTLALWVGTTASGGAYPQKLNISRRVMIPLVLTSILGGLAGAFLLIKTSAQTFLHVLPWLLLGATLLFAFGKHLTGRISAGISHDASNASVAGASLFELLVAVYGGYFGAGMGIVFLAVLDWFSPGNLQDNNAIKNWLQCLVNVVATLIFLAKGLVLIVPGIALMAGGLVGGYVSGQLARRLDPKVLRLGVVAYGIIITCVFAARLF